MINLYDIYLQSQKYFDGINEVTTNDGRRIGLLYQFVSKNFCNYFEHNKPHMLKAKENINHSNKSMFKDNNLINNNENNDHENDLCDINYN